MLRICIITKKTDGCGCVGDDIYKPPEGPYESVVKGNIVVKKDNDHMTVCMINRIRLNSPFVGSLEACIKKLIVHEIAMTQNTDATAPNCLQIACRTHKESLFSTSPIEYRLPIA